MHAIDEVALAVGGDLEQPLSPQESKGRVKVALGQAGLPAHSRCWYLSGIEAVPKGPVGIGDGIRLRGSVQRERISSTKRSRRGSVGNVHVIVEHSESLQQRRPRRW